MHSKSRTGYYTPRFRMAAAVYPQSMQVAAAVSAHGPAGSPSSAMAPLPGVAVQDSSRTEFPATTPTGAHRMGSLEYLILGVLVLGGTIAVSWERIVNVMMEVFP
jgi:hypothetical protein